MSDYCVVVADRARARLFSLQEGGISESGPELVEIADLSNAEAEAAGKEIYSDEKSGRNASSAGGGAHGYDDHRNRHEDENAHRFAKQILIEAEDAVERQNAVCLVLVADPRMMGFLREQIGTGLAGLEIKELVKDLTKLSLQDIHEHLAADHLIPPRAVVV